MKISKKDHSSGAEATNNSVCHTNAVLSYMHDFSPAA